MKKLFSLFVFVIVGTGLLLGQTLITPKDMSSAEKEGRILFKAKLTDAIFSAFSDQNISTMYPTGIWTLKFDNGAVTRIQDRNVGYQVKSIFKDGKYPIWWLGKSYIVYWDMIRGESEAICQLLPEEIK